MQQCYRAALAGAAVPVAAVSEAWPLLAALLLGIVVAAVHLYRSGRKVPGNVAARLYLWQRLQAAGLTGRIPPACVNELADRELGRAVAVPLIDRLDALAVVIGRFAEGRDPGPPLRSVTDILRRHGVGSEPAPVAAPGRPADGPGDGH